MKRTWSFARFEHTNGLLGSPANVRIHLMKNIPVGRGLGGGSSDAAVTFIGLQRLFKRALSVRRSS